VNRQKDRTSAAIARDKHNGRVHQSKTKPSAVFSAQLLAQRIGA